jgi:hypothetical protein
VVAYVSGIIHVHKCIGPIVDREAHDGDVIGVDNTVHADVVVHKYRGHRGYGQLTSHTLANSQP